MAGAGPGLEGGQVAALRSHVRFLSHATGAAYSWENRMYVSQCTKCFRAQKRAEAPKDPGPVGYALASQIPRSAPLATMAAAL
jgi:hypothetical protein